MEINRTGEDGSKNIIVLIYYIKLIQNTEVYYLTQNLKHNHGA